MQRENERKKIANEWVIQTGNRLCEYYQSKKDQQVATDEKTMKQEQSNSVEFNAEEAPPVSVRIAYICFIRKTTYK